MDIIQSDTNGGKKSVIFDDHTYRLSNVLRNGDKSYRCTKKSCKARITTDADSKTIYLYYWRKCNILFVAQMKYGLWHK